jgi:PAS domain-containing protein
VVSVSAGVPSGHVDRQLAGLPVTATSDLAAAVIGADFVEKSGLERSDIKHEALQQMLALVVWERLPAPTLAVDREGNILFANGAFCDMLGHPPSELLSMKFGDIFCSLPTHDCAVALVRAHADRLVELAHKDDHPVLASTSKSAMRRRDDTVALATFHERTKELWLNNFAAESARETQPEDSGG